MLVTNILQLAYIKLCQKCLSFANASITTMHFYTNILYKCIFILNRTEWIVSNLIKQYKRKNLVLLIRCFLIKPKKLFTT